MPSSNSTNKTSLRLPNPVRAIATGRWPGHDETDLPVYKNQPLTVVSLEGDHWVKVKHLNEERYVPRSYIQFLGPVSLVNDSDSAKTAYRTWVRQLGKVLGAAGMGGDGVDERKGREVEMRQEGKVKEDKKVRWTKVDWETFPFPPREICTCEVPICKARKEETKLGACRHDVGRLLKGVGAEYSAAWLWKESLKWHPDKWTRFLANDFVEGPQLVTEMFVIVKALADEKREQEGNATAAR